MGILFLLIGISLVVGLCFLAAFFWAFKSGQFEDTCTPGMRILDIEEPTLNDPIHQTATLPEKPGNSSLYDLK